MVILGNLVADVLYGFVDPTHQVLRVDMERIELTARPRHRWPRPRRRRVDEVDLIPVRTYWQLVRQRFLQHRLAVIALFLMVILVDPRDRHPDR